MAEQVRKGLNDAISRQKEGLLKRPQRGFRAERIREALESERYSVNEGSLGVQAVMEVPLIVRFADMKHLGNVRVYNHPVWDTFYERTLQDIRYEYREWIRRNFGDSLRQ